MRPSRALALALVATSVALGGMLPVAAHARTTPAEITAAELPPEAREVLAKIEAGGPFRYSRDGIVFGNREHRLPGKPHGYYHEYTVYTPGSKDRGARRVICGGPKTRPDACWYTADHYNSFRRIVP
ncbi:MAG: ribonuclease [Proteobacteria bacterium]|nr:ribonuclease [Pseudomonadota bacterium]